MTRRLATTPAAVSVADAQTAATLTQWQLPPLIADAQLVITELAANASARASADDGWPAVQDRFLAWMAIRLSDTGPTVRDRGLRQRTRHPTLRDADPLTGNGPGLHIVHALATAWDWYQVTTGSGKVVRAAFDHAGTDPQDADRPVPLPRRTSASGREAHCVADGSLLRRVRNGLLALPDQPTQPVLGDPAAGLSLFRRPSVDDPQHRLVIDARRRQLSDVQPRNRRFHPDRTDDPLTARTVPRVRRGHATARRPLVPGPRLDSS
jgi:hypothetical protein